MRPPTAQPSNEFNGPVDATHAPPVGALPRADGAPDRWSRWTRWLSPHCLMCAATSGDPLCITCADAFFDASAHRCRVCALRLGAAAAQVCGGCLRQPRQFDATLALSDYAAPVDGLVVALKFGHRLEIARALGLLLGRRLARAGTTDAIIVAVPLAYERLQDRGFNQSQEIARHAARVAGLRVERGALLRTRHRPPQEGLDLAERRRNVRDAFVVPRVAEAALAGRSVVVIDDVMTSGSTLDEVARVLKRAGVTHVTNAIIARTP